MTAIQSAIAWAYLTVSTIAPPGRPIYFPDAKETVEETEARQLDIAEDFVEIHFNPDTKPIFSGEDGRSRTLMLQIAIATNESGFRKDVDFALGKWGRGDGGRSWCLVQLNIGKGTTMPWNYTKNRMPNWGDPDSEIFHGFSGPELVTDRRKCISEGLKYMHVTMHSCRSNQMNHRLAGYIIGVCRENPEWSDAKKEAFQDALRGSENRFQNAALWYKQHKDAKTFDDAEVVSEWATWQATRNSDVVSWKTSTDDSRTRSKSLEGTVSN